MIKWIQHVNKDSILTHSRLLGVERVSGISECIDRFKHLCDVTEAYLEVGHAND